MTNYANGHCANGSKLPLREVACSYTVALYFAQEFEINLRAYTLFTL